MSVGTYKQERINKYKPFKSEPIITANILLEIKQSSSGNTDITMKQSENDAYKIVKKINGRQVLLILTNSKIVFYLSKNNKYRWSDQYDGITTKLLLKEFYGGIIYDDELDKEVFLISPYYYEFDKDCDRSIEFSPGFSKMTYYAKLNEHGVPATSHEFNLNIDLKQADGTWTPITIDPIMKNPPPIIPFYYKEYYGIDSDE
jgi:hypothetical protein